jgi:hypothetical protein
MTATTENEGDGSMFSWDRLRSDERGAVMVMGVIFAALLVGIIWHMVGVGDAIIFRERMQEASDATAFESAVWHARTMNLLVVLNIVMSAILAVLVLWRTVELLLAVAGVVLALLALIPFMEWLGALSDAAFNTLERMASKDTEIYEKVEQWLIRVNKAEKMVSTWAPIVDVAQPVLDNSGYYAGNAVNVTFPASTSIVPSIESFIGHGFPPRMNMSTVLPAMPVQEDGYWKLCTKAGAFVPIQIGDFLKRLNLGAAGDAIDHIGSFFGQITGSMPGYFCGSLVTPDGVEQAVTGASKKECDSEKDTYDHSNDGGAPDKPFDYKKCMDKNKKKIAAKKDQISTKPAKVWDVARNGGLFFQTWSFTQGSANWSYNDDPGVELANGGGGGTGLGDQFDYHWSTAEGEYYYDGSDAWDVCSGDAMWNIKWRARLRRVTDPVRMFDAAGIATGWLVNGLNKGATRFIQAKIPSEGFNWLKKSSFDTWLSNELVKKRILRNNIEHITYGAGMQNLGNWVMDHVEGNDRTKMIH